MDKRINELHRTIESFHRHTRDIEAEVLIYFDGIDNEPLIVDRENYLVDFDLLEELATSSENPIGPMAANELDITLFNANRMFSAENTEGPYYGKITTNIPIKVRMREAMTESEWINLGTYYVSDWKTSTETLLVNITSYDALYHLLSKPVPVIPVKHNITIGEFITDVLNASGVSKSKVKIDPIIGNQIMKYGYVLSGTLSNTFQKLAEAYLFYFFVDRDGFFTVLGLQTSKEPIDTFDGEFVYSADSSKSLLRSYSSVKCFYYIKQASDVIQLASVTKFEAAPGQSKMVSISPSSGPIVSLEYLVYNTETDIKTSNYSHKSWELGFEITNNTDKPAILDISLMGSALKTQTTASVDAVAQDLIKTVGLKEFAVKNDYIESHTQAELISNTVLQYIKDDEALVEVKHRGNPLVKPGDVVLLDSSGHTGTRLVVSQSFKYNGALEATSKVIKREVV